MRTNDMQRRRAGKMRAHQQRIGIGDALEQVLPGVARGHGVQVEAA